MIELTELPYPLSNNRIYVNIPQRGRVTTKEAKQWMKTCMGLVKMQKVKIIHGDIVADVLLHPKKKKDGTAYTVRPDLDNCTKLLFDSLNGIAYDDDKQIVDLRIRVGKPVEGGGLTVTLVEKATEHQADLALA